MQWIVDNWLILLLGGGMVAMHLFGHGHGGHGGHGRGNKKLNIADGHRGHEHEVRDARGRADDEGATARERPADEGRA